METKEPTVAQLLSTDTDWQTPLMPTGVPFVSRSATTETWEFAGTSVKPLATSRETHGEFALLDVTMQRCLDLPPHLHHNESETFYLLEGAMRFEVGNEVIEAGPGDAVHLPRGLRHACHVVSGQARALLLITPGGGEQYYRELSKPERGMIAPGLRATPDRATLQAVASKFGVQQF
ncbi:cupin domain-containing protein [Solirubrum puertoriconensis]|uniref:Cupin type-2 domain-containing protein n=1 Tax=Solirubrum puertoriconensis TaxID=1751427 RepID=A0A9X0L381_SOLP1|nr:cupin domain-containing protein [Solirubrum puertoriconensis]KUG06247.1 hypothetical protein ASU33_02470 [Solirubrum puertoriconensis]